MALKLSLLLLLLCCSTRAAIINIGCTYPEITNAILTTVQEGDTILIGPGECTISNFITINRSISFTIAGSGTNSTTLKTATSYGMLVYTSSTNVFTIRDLNLVCHSGTVIWLLIGTTTFEFAGQYHLYNLKMTNVMGRGISFGAGKSRNSYGLLDHSTFVAATNGLFQQAIDFSGSGINSWTNANPLGTTNVSCVEDCYFSTLTNGAGGNGFFDSYVGAQVVFRHNVCNGYAPIGGHGYDSQVTSIRTWEIYNNLFTNHQGGGSATYWRGGSGVVFSNQFWGNMSSPAALLYYRATIELFPSPAQRSGYLPQGTPGQGYVVNYQGTQMNNGTSMCFTNQPVNLETVVMGNTVYTFLTNLNDTTAGMVDVAQRGGGSVKIGTNVAESIIHWYNAINLVPSAFGTSYTNAPGKTYKVGYEFIAIGYDANNLVLTNALDCNTNQFGYPAFHQPGVITSKALTDTNFVQIQTKWPAYCWGNSINGSPDNGMVIGAPGTYMTNLVALNRDYFTDVSPSAEVYTPLVYPHPLSASFEADSVAPAVTIGSGVTLGGGVTVR